MGSSESKCNEIEHLPPEIEEKATKFFNMIDTNRSKTIDKEETLQFWKKNFPKLNTNELFSQVDKNNDGAIQYDEWIDFWLLVLRTGHSVESVSQELDNLLNGGSWVKFENVDNTKGKKMKIKSEGKY